MGMFLEMYPNSPHLDSTAYGTSWRHIATRKLMVGNPDREAFAAPIKQTVANVR